MAKKQCQRTMKIRAIVFIGVSYVELEYRRSQYFLIENLYVRSGQNVPGQKVSQCHRSHCETPRANVTRPSFPYFENSFLGRNLRRLHVLQLRISPLHPPNIVNAYPIELRHF